MRLVNAVKRLCAIRLGISNTFQLKKKPRNSCTEITLKRTENNSYIFVVVVSDGFVVGDSFLFLQSFWCQFGVPIVQLAVINCIHFVEVERETQAILQTCMETLLPAGEAEILKNVPLERKILLRVFSQGERHFFAHSIRAKTYGRVNGKHQHKITQQKHVVVINFENVKQLSLLKMERGRKFDDVATD